MMRTPLLQRGFISVSDFRCTAGPDDRPFVEQFDCHSISYVRKGSFGCRTRGRSFELVAGSILVGHPGDEYLCSHEHHVHGDECLSFFLTPELVEAIGDRTEVWRVGAAPPLPELMVLGELAQAAAEGRNDVGLDEIGQLLANRFVEVVSGRTQKPMPAASRDRRRAVETALWIDANSHRQIDLEHAARRPRSARSTSCGCFPACSGVTPHQYLVRSRLRHAARLLADDETPSPMSPMMSVSPICPISCARSIAPPGFRRAGSASVAGRSQDFPRTPRPA